MTIADCFVHQQKILNDLTASLCDLNSDKKIVDSRIKRIIREFQIFETIYLDWETCLIGLNDTSNDLQRVCFLVLAHSKLALSKEQNVILLKLFTSIGNNTKWTKLLFVNLKDYHDIYLQNYQSSSLDENTLQNFLTDSRTLSRLSLLFSEQIIRIKKKFSGRVFNDKCIQHMCDMRPLAIFWNTDPLTDLAGTFKIDASNIYRKSLVSYFQTSDSITALASYRFANQVLISKCLEVIQKNNRKKENSLLSRYILSVSEEVYNHCYRAIKATPLPTRSLGNVLKNEARQVFLFGIGTQEHLSLKEIKYQKQLADCGYNMRDKLSECLSRIRVSSSKNWLNEIGCEIREFIKWADEYPHLAEEITVSIALALSRLESDNFFTPIKGALKAKLIVHAFLGGLGEEKKYSFDPNSRYLHFLAIRDFCSYLPEIISIVKSCGDITGSTLFDLVNAAGKFYQTRMQKRIIKQIPYNWTAEAISLINIIRGDSFYELLQSNAEMQMIKFAGTFRKAVLNPRKLWKYLKLEFFKWWIPLKKSEGFERFCRSLIHIGLPAVSAGAVIGAFTLTGILSALSLSLGILTLSLVFYRISRSLLDKHYHVNSDFDSRKEFSLDELKNDETSFQVFQTKIHNFLDNARRTYALMQAAEVNPNPAVQHWFENHSSEIQGLAEDLLDLLDQEENTTIQEIFNSFNKTLQPETLRTQLKKLYPQLFEGLKKDSPLAKEYLAHNLIKRLEQQWLIPKVTAFFTDCYAKNFALNSTNRDKNLNRKLNNQLEECAPLLQKDRWSNAEVKNIVKKLAVHEPSLRKGSLLVETTEDMIDHIFPRF